MLAEDLNAENLFTIASNTEATPELLEEIAAHTACYPKLKAWAEYVGQTGERTAVPAPPSPEDDFPPPPEETEVKPAKKGLFDRSRAKDKPDYAPLPAKNRRVALVAGGAGLVGVLVIAGAVWAIQASQPTPAPAQAAPSASPAPTPIEVVETLSASGDGFTCNAEGDTVNCYGQNHLGQLGAGMASTEHIGQVKLDGEIRLLSAGADFVCVSTGKGVTCWGDNRWKMVGDTDTQILPPTPVASFVGKPVSSLSAGELHVCIVSEGQVYCWGSGFSGQMADGQEGPKASGVKKIPLPEGQTAEQVLSPRFGTCVTTKQAKVYCWGSNEGARIAEGEAQYLGLTDMTQPPAPAAKGNEGGEAETPEGEEGQS